MESFQAKSLDVQLTHWDSLMRANFSHVRVLDFALTANDLLLELVGKHCPQLEFLNATSKYKRFHHERNDESRALLPVTDKGLAHLHKCQKLKTLVINEPRGALTRFGGRIWANEITYNGLRQLLKAVRSLEELSYSDLGTVISYEFADVDQLNLKVVRQFNPSETTIREILRLCPQLQQLTLMCYDAHLPPDALALLCEADIRLTEVRFQNVYLGQYFEQFFRKFGENLVELSLSYHLSEINFSHFVSIGQHCLNLKVFDCNQLAKTPAQTRVFLPRNLSHKPFSQLEELKLSGEDIEVSQFLHYCTQHADNFQVLKLHEERTMTNIDNIFLTCVCAKGSLRRVDLSRRLPMSKQGIKQIIQNFPNLEYFKVYCAEICDDLIREYDSQNYQFDLIVKNRLDGSAWLQ